MSSTPSTSISMNLLADESVDGPVVERLRQEGHEVVYVAEISPSVVDEEVLQRANTSAALLVTADKDFGELVFRQGRLHAGVVLLRLAGLPPALFFVETWTLSTVWLAS